MSITLAGIALFALAAWILVPTGGDAGQVDGVSAGAGGTGAATTTNALSQQVPGSVPNSAVPGGSAATNGTSGGAAQGTSGGSSSQTGAATSTCAKTPSGPSGVTDKTITVAVSVLNVAGPVGNSAAGLASPDDLKKMAQAIADDINERGGVQCRTIALRFYEGNPLSQDQQHATCLQIAQDHPLVTVDMGAYAYPPGAYNCIAQMKIPMIANALVLPSEVDRFYPYLATSQSDTDTVMRDTALGLKQRGWFDPGQGFKKLGLLVDDCSPEVNRQLDTYLGRAGVPSTAISKYTFACAGSGGAPPNEMSAAVSQHRLDGVTNVIPLTGGLSFNEYTNIANAQGFKPKYAVTEYEGLVFSAVGPASPQPDNFDGAVAMSILRYGQESAPQQDAATQRCQAILTKAGYPADWVFQKGGGIGCDVIWIAEAAIRHAPSLTREALVPSLFGAGLVPLPFPATDTMFKAPKKLFGGDTWWPIQWHKDCSCWRPLEPGRHPSFAP